MYRKRRPRGRGGGQFAPMARATQVSAGASLSLASEPSSINAPLSPAQHLPQSSDGPRQLTPSQTCERDFEAMSDRALASEENDWIVSDVATMTKKPENLDRIVQNPDVAPEAIYEACKNETATIKTWNTALLTLKKRMTTTPVTLPPDHAESMKKPSELRPRDHNSDIRSTAGWIAGRNTPARPLPPATKALAEEVWKMARHRSNELDKLKAGALR